MFLNANLKDPGCLIEKPVSAYEVKKGAVCFVGVHATKKFVLRLSLAVQSMYSQPPCRIHICNEEGAYDHKVFIQSFFLFIQAILYNSIHN
jgi:hypothetical protein